MHARVAGKAANLKRKPSTARILSTATVSIVKALPSAEVLLMTRPHCKGKEANSDLKDAADAATGDLFVKLQPGAG
jgi:hypothetical protein